MLFKTKDLTGFKIEGSDGELGKLKEFYFDDHFWTVRYLIADTGNWLMDRQVLISPYALIQVHPEQHTIGVTLTKKQIEHSPALSTDLPVSRQFEDSYYGYYGWPGYWTGISSWGDYPSIQRDRALWADPKRVERAHDPDLRSTRDVTGHVVQATDGEVGFVSDFVICDETWAIRYLVVDSHRWIPGKKVLISPEWVTSVNWGESKVFINVSR